MLYMYVFSFPNEAAVGNNCVLEYFHVGCITQCLTENTLWFINYFRRDTTRGDWDTKMRTGRNLWIRSVLSPGRTDSRAEPSVVDSTGFPYEWELSIDKGSANVSSKDFSGPWSRQCAFSSCAPLHWLRTRLKKAMGPLCRRYHIPPLLWRWLILNPLSERSI